MHISAVRTVAAHGILGITTPLVALHLGGRATPGPMIVEGGVKGEGVELLHGRIGIKWIIKFARAVQAFEEHAQAMLGNQVTAGAALDADPAVSLKFLSPVRPP